MPSSSRRSRPTADDADGEQRPRQRQRRDDPESDVDEEEEAEDAEDAEDGDQVESADGQLIKKLVRYALACDFARAPIRRDGIKEKVLGDRSRSFRRVFDGAQKTLRAVFGMEMVELPVRDKLTKEEKRKAAKSKSKSSNSNSYILVSVLPDAYKTSKIIAPSKFLSAEDEAAYVAFYTVLVSLIRLNGGEMSDSRLKRYLRRLNAETNSFHSTKTEDTLSRLQRQGYLIKNIDKEARQHGDEQEATTWYVGPRGKIEVGDEVVAGVVREVWGQQDDDELESKLQNSLQIQEKKVSVQNGDAVGDGASNGGNESASVDNGEGPSRRRSGRRRQVEEDQDEEE
ncbi:hypothetical protein KVR01_002530 [Diaporthe batatas]|uniref:uncharacterized protein n=1 Tax=Diaporthe batatas TaxID=748121 RepID=UPI001D04323D|nr:uncharacterized protein KVR01_002530 [Diaporthe batatas]KAG8166841.1 hypothetical protein KVR01_002530 [Diaporthe batatas]